MDNQQTYRGRYFAAAVASAVILGGLVTFSGWYFEVPALIDWFGLRVTMKANPAVASVLVGTALLTTALSPRHSRLIQLTALCAALIGLATLLQHVSGWNLGIDTLLFSEAPNQPGTAAPGRMGPPAATSFLLLGTGLTMLTRGYKRLALACAFAVLALGSLSLVGYWYGAEVMYTVPRLTGISLQMSLLLLSMSVGTIAAIPDAGPMKILFGQGDAREIAWVLLPAAIIVPMATGWLRLLGERIGLYEFAFASALRTIVEMSLLCALSWWAVRAIQNRDEKRLAAEQARELTERRFQLVLEASAVPFIVLAPVYDAQEKVVDFEWTYLNTSAANAFGRPSQQLLGRKVSEVLPGSWQQPGLFDRYVSVLQQKRIEEFELHSTASGIEGWFHVVASPFDRHIAVWFADVTVRKQQELELRRADRRKDEFLATLAHELRNPLAPIRQAALLARKQTLNDPQRQWCNDVIERQVQHMSLLLDDLLDVSRITRGTLQLRRATTSIQSIVQSAVETVRPLIEQKKHSLKLAMPEPDLMVTVDPLRMAQAISNLLSNAAKYTDPGGAISLHVSAEGASLALKVIDNGTGISAQHKTEIFRMFGQIKDDEERSEGGLGIGLALTKGLVELHGGSINVHSAGRGQGSTFSILIPNAIVEAAPDGSPDRAPVKVEVVRRVLVADDNVDAAESLAMLLQADGHEVRIAHDGHSALKLALQFKPDIALLDVGMPGMSGHDVAKAIRGSDLDGCPVLIAITGWGQQSDRDRSVDAGFNHHLTKPVDYAELILLLQPQ